MTKAQLWSVWLCGVALSGVFIFLGFTHGYWFSGTGIDPDYFRPDATTEHSDTRSWVEGYIEGSSVNWYLALLAPTVILSACTLATAFGATRPDKS